LIEFYWQERIRQQESTMASLIDEQEEIYARRQIQWMRETKMAVVIS